MNVTITVDGTPVTSEVEPRTMLAEWLRSHGRTGVHIGCDTTSCGACTVLVDGAATKACTMLAVQAHHRDVVTIHGLTPTDGLSPVQQAFTDEHALQCGFCTPGLVVAVTALLSRQPHPDDRQIIEELEGNLCRCTGYTPIIRAVHRAAALIDGTDSGIVAGRAHQEPAARTMVEAGPVVEDLSDTEVV